jgi:hypothetical protein
MELQDKIVKLYDEGFTAGKIAQKLKIKKVQVEEVLGTNAKPSGLGDTISGVTEALGLDKVAEKVADAVGADDCGCKARAKALNELFPYKKMSNLSDEDYVFLDGFFQNLKGSIKPDIQKLLVDVYNRVFNAKRKVSNCSPCVASMIRDLRKVYDYANK